MARAIPPPSEILKSISLKAASVRDGATALALRVSQFEGYLANLPGRVEAVASGPLPESEDQRPAELVLRLHRSGKDWVISYTEQTRRTHTMNQTMQAIGKAVFGTFGSSEPQPEITWKRLSDAPLKVKLAAVNIFPDLLFAIEQSQGKMIDVISNASTLYDDFAKSLSLPPIDQTPSRVATDNLERWKTVMEIISAKSPGIGGLLQQAVFVGVADGAAIIRYSAAEQVFVKMLERNGKKDMVREVIQQVFGRALELRWEILPADDDPSATVVATSPPPRPRPKVKEGN